MAPKRKSEKPTSTGSSSKKSKTEVPKVLTFKQFEAAAEVSESTSLTDCQLNEDRMLL